MSRYDEDLAIETLKSAIANATPERSMYEILLDSGLTSHQIQAVTMKLATQAYEKTIGPIMIPRIGIKKASGR